jgi:hypothetical protein
MCFHTTPAVRATLNRESANEIGSLRETALVLIPIVAEKAALKVKCRTAANDSFPPFRGQDASVDVRPAEQAAGNQT